MLIPCSTLVSGFGSDLYVFGVAGHDHIDTLVPVCGGDRIHCNAALDRRLLFGRSRSAQFVGQLDSNGECSFSAQSGPERTREKRFPSLGEWVAPTRLLQSTIEISGACTRRCIYAAPCKLRAGAVPTLETESLISLKANFLPFLFHSRPLRAPQNKRFTKPISTSLFLLALICLGAH